MRSRSALVGAFVSTSLLLTGAPAGAEVPLADLVWFPPGLEESRRWAVGLEEFLVQEAGVSTEDMVGGVTAVAQGDDWSGDLIVRAVRFISPQVAEEAARTLATRDVGPVIGLGSLGEGFVVSPDPDLEDPSPLHVHDGFRVMGRDLVVFATYTVDDAAVPQGFLDHMAAHAARFPGSSAPVPGTAGRPLPLAVAVVLGGAVAVAAVGAAASRRRRPPPAVSAVGPVSRPWVA